MIQKNIFSLLCFFILISTSCKKDLTGLELGQEFTLKYGQTAKIKDLQTGQNINIKFNEVIKDTRCPKDFICEQPDYINIELLLDKEKLLELSPINTTPKDTFGILPYKEYKLLLLSVDPIPSSNKEIKKGNYTATLKITK